MEVNKLKLLVENSRQYKNNWVSEIGMAFILYMYLRSDFDLSVFNMKPVIALLVEMDFLLPSIDWKEFQINPKLYESV